ncbi:hypothetical protein STAQ_10540 [Allostella sp. ATCC 35155]|nr:hypothetical protein STAQ_10540 [Stella sp. ATCC 35155]
MNLAAAHAARGRDVALATLGRPRWRPATRLIVLDRPATMPARLDRRWDAAAVEAVARQLVETCRRERPDLLHFHYVRPFAAAAARLGELLGPGAPVAVGTIHGTDLTEVTPECLRSVLAGTAHLTAVSTAYARLAEEVLGRRPAVVANFARPGPPTVPARHGRGQLPIIAHVSSFRPVKAADAAARAFLSVRRQARCRLWLIGDGPDAPALRRALRPGRADIAWLGFRHDVAALLQRATLLLVTSRAESFGLAALEAMAGGVPVVAPRIGGLPEVVGDGVGGDGAGGLLFHPGRSADAAAKVLTLLRREPLRRALARGARRRARLFGEDAAIAGYDCVYRQALAARPVPVGP